MKNFFYKLFHKNIENENVEKVEEVVVEVKNDSFSDKIRTEVDFSEITKGVEIEEFLKQIEKNDEILESLSIDRLKDLENFFEERVNKKRKMYKILALAPDNITTRRPDKLQEILN